MYSMNNLIEEMKFELDRELRNQIARLNQVYAKPFMDMLTYHMGWSGDGSGAMGKRIRPVLLLLVNHACKMDWRKALPAAAAVELTHNFSLVHDDIQDRSEKRHGRDTVWIKWGIPMAINAGDALFVISNQAMQDLHSAFPAEVVLKAWGELQVSCLALTVGQYLDMSFEGRTNLTLDDYWCMVNGKTAALLSTCTYLGSILSHASEAVQDDYKLFGFHLGRAFQIQDDVLGIWGNSSLTGKPTGSDLIDKKNSLPVISGIAKEGKFARLWNAGINTAEDAENAASLLKEEGALQFAHGLALEESEIARDHLRHAGSVGEAGEALNDILSKLIDRPS
jgi:geranylgeranyl diphosphate synthase type I